MIDENDFAETLRRFSEQLETTDPRIADIFQQLRAGYLDETEAMKQIMAFAAESPEWGATVETEALKAFQPILQEGGMTSLMALPDRGDFLERWGMEEADLIYQSAPNRQPQLHPMIQGMIGELLQYDGDVPELRTGRLPEDGSPAVPIKTKARNPIAIGAMLKKASEEVHAELKEAEVTQAAALTSAMEDGDALAVQQVLSGSMAVSVPGYETGKSPALRVVDEPDSHALVRLTMPEKQELWFKALSSTQGRKSAVPVIADLVMDDLREKGLDVQWGRPPGPQATQTAAEWTVEIFGSKDEANPHFSYIDVAARSLSRKLQVDLDKKINTTGKLALHVRPINTVEERVVGWSASLYTS